MEDEDPSRPSLRKTADAGQPLIVPWMRKQVTLGTAFQSSLMSSEREPWVSQSPFDVKHPAANSMIYEGEVDGKAAFKDAESTSHSTELSHYSGSLGVTVGCPFLSANVTGTYDKTILESKDSNKVSKTCFFRAGCVRFAKEPSLSAEARSLLRSPNGEQKFRTTFGDYYVAGYILGGDTGVYVSVSQSSRDTKTSTSITVTVKVLFFSKSWTETSTETTHDESLECVFCGYDTMSASQKADTAKNKGEYSNMRALTQAYLGYVEQLPRRVMQELKTLDIAKHKQLSEAHCGKICDSGLVVQLMLMPFSCLRDYKTALLESM